MPQGSILNKGKNLHDLNKKAESTIKEAGDYINTNALKINDTKTQKKASEIITLFC